MNFDTHHDFQYDTYVGIPGDAIRKIPTQLLTRKKLDTNEMALLS